MDAGVKMYQYQPGMMHSKMLLIDSEWASVGTANLDNRSLHLNFEVTCLFDDPRIVADLEVAFEQDLTLSRQVEAATFATRPISDRLAENFCRLLSPVL
jgi:cardiolipin synthase